MKFVNLFSIGYNNSFSHKSNKKISSFYYFQHAYYRKSKLPLLLEAVMVDIDNICYESSVIISFLPMLIRIRSYIQDMTMQGRSIYDCIMMFKLVLLGPYILSDRELAS